MKFVIFLLIAFQIGSVLLLDKEGWKSKTIYQVLIDRFYNTNMANCANLNDYCGGTFKGLQYGLRYIKDLGFDAIWINPIVENVEYGYHGYFAKDLYKINSKFGTEQDFKDLIAECHRLDMKIMLDIVLNHVGPVGTNFTQINPFNKNEHYHSPCQISEEDINQQNQWAIENCRLHNLPDLNQQNPWVEQTLLEWVKNLIEKYEIDGLRIDSVPFVPMSFWEKFKEIKGNIFTMASVPFKDATYIKKYTTFLDSALSYHLVDAIRDTFSGEKSMFNLKAWIEKSFNTFGEDVYTMGNFFGNHELARFMGKVDNRHKLRSAIAFIMMFAGIPVFYYGDEQYFKGLNIPDNRETLWQKMNPDTGVYYWMYKLIDLRKKYKIWENPYVEMFVNENTLVYMRGNIIVAHNNNQKLYSIVNKLKVPFKDGTIVRELYSKIDSVVENGMIQIILAPNEVKILEPFDMENRY